MSTDLVNFLRARLDEAEDDVEIAHTAGCPSYLLDLTDDQLYEPADPSRCSCHARRDLLDIAAKRAILAEHRGVRFTDVQHGLIDVVVCRVCHALHPVSDEDDFFERQVDHPCPTVRLLAAVYADHPDYRPEWKVQP